MISMWVDWLAERVDAESDEERRTEAMALLALLDGALLVHHLGHPDAARLAIEVATR